VKYDVEDLAVAFIRLDNGATLILETSWDGYSEKKEDMVTQILGTKGGIIQRNFNEGYNLHLERQPHISDETQNRNRYGAFCRLHPR